MVVITKIFRYCAYKCFIFKQRTPDAHKQAFMFRHRKYKAR